MAPAAMDTTRIALACSLVRCVLVGAVEGSAGPMALYTDMRLGGWAVWVVWAWAQAQAQAWALRLNYTPERISNNTCHIALALGMLIPRLKLQVPPLTRRTVTLDSSQIQV